MTKNLHNLIGTTLEKFNNLPGISVMLDHECGGKQRIALFTTDKKSRSTNYCWPDACILKDDEIKTIIEIEQTGEPSPAKLSSKILPVALSRFVICRDKLPIASQATLIQIVNGSQFRSHTSKREQYANFESDIQRLLPIGVISKYFLLIGDAATFLDDAKDHLSLLTAIDVSLSS